MDIFKKVSLINVVAITVFATTSLASTGTVTASALKLRKEPNTSADVITSIYEDSSVEILEENGEWFKVKYDGETGYVASKFIKKGSSTTKTENKTTNTATNTTTEKEKTNTTTATTNTTKETTTTEKKEEPKAEPKTTKITGDGNVVVKDSYLRSMPSLIAKPVTQVSKGKIVELGSKIGNWQKVTEGDVTGWIPTSKLGSEVIIEEPVEETATETKTEEKAEEKKEEKKEETKTTEKKDTTTETKKEETKTSSSTGKKGIVTVETARVRESGSLKAEVIGSLDKDDEVTIEAEEGDWYKVSGSGITSGYVSKSLIKVSGVTSRGSNDRDTSLIGEEPAKEETNKVEEQAPVATAAPAPSAQGAAVIEFAKQYLGYPYVAAGKNPSTGFDCSGFTQYVFSNFGISLGGSAASQTGNGTEVARANLQTGDLVLFYDDGYTKVGHAGIYISDGNFIHAANPKRGVVIDNLNTSSYYNPRYVTARRLVN